MQIYMYGFQRDLYISGPTYLVDVLDNGTCFCFLLNIAELHTLVLHEVLLHCYVYFGCMDLKSRLHTYIFTFPYTVPLQQYQIVSEIMRLVLVHFDVTMHFTGHSKFRLFPIANLLHLIRLYF